MSSDSDRQTPLKRAEKVEEWTLCQEMSLTVVDPHCLPRTQMEFGDFSALRTDSSDWQLIAFP